MITGACYCNDILGYQRDLSRLETAKAELYNFDVALDSIQRGLTQLKTSTTAACNVDMAGYSPYALLSRCMEESSGGKAAIASKSNSVQSSINTMKVKDRQYHKSLLDDMQEGR